jgi:hypothetical protein
LNYNPAIATSIRSNHDVSWIPTSTKALAYIYYLTNYATKTDVSPQQMLVKARLLAESRQKLTSAIDDTDCQDWKFLLHLYNYLAHGQEISGVQIASSLLQFPGHYASYSKFAHVHLSHLRSHFRALLQGSSTSEDDSCMLHARTCLPKNRFDNYRWRGESLKDFSFFEYCMLVQTGPMRDASSADCPYDTTHPKHSAEVQRLVKTLNQISTVCVHGSLSQFQQEEEKVPRGHTITSAIKNDVAEVLLAFFVPWDKIPSLFTLHCPDHAVRTDANSHVWTIVEPTLLPHLRQYARNFSLIHKSKEDMAIDMSLRAMETGDMELVEDPAMMSDDDIIPDSSVLHNCNFSTETLLMACNHIVSTWFKDDLMMAQRFGHLHVDWSHSTHLEEENLVSLDLPASSFYPASGLRFPERIIHQWEQQLKTPVSSATTDSTADVTDDFIGASDDIDGQR